MAAHRPAAAVALAAVSLLLVGCSALGGGGGAPTPTPTGVPEVDVVDLAVGDCLDTHGRPGVTAAVPVVDCSVEHDSEAYASIALDDGEFPGDDSVKSSAQAGCTEAFTAFAGIDYESSTLDYAYYFPTRGSWATGDRRILCLILDPEQRVTGTLEGATR